MFTGIVTELGSVHTVDRSADVVRIRIDAPGTVDGLTLGDSVAVNGVCLTVVDMGDGAFSVEAVPETMRRSSLGVLEPGSPVNLERPMAGDGRFDGHIVQGHVDAAGRIASVTDDGGSLRFRIAFPQEFARYVVEKGSICVDGVSLTVTGVSPTDAADAWFEFVVIPHTARVTVLGSKGPDDPVNLEVDVIAKYVERLMEERS
ncbi:MAG: riboflavin synthase [Acidimicrobiia bacterium]|nr:riboflavin synthase [Acidimicrobiia bacterium]